VGIERDLIYDIGMHKGEDSAYYLAKGYRVVGFEANPDLAAQCRDRFKGLEHHTTVEGAITHGEGTVHFYRHPYSVWGTTSKEQAERNYFCQAGDSERLEVTAIDLAAVLRQTGIPAFIKIDIEGADLLCLQTLLGFEERPEYVSIEAAHDNWTRLKVELALLSQLGYGRFSIVQQATIPSHVIETRTLVGEPLRYEFEPDASGPFGDDLSDWLTRDEAEDHYRRINRVDRALQPIHSFLRKSQIGRGIRGQAIRCLGPMPGWFDTHAAR